MGGAREGRKEEGLALQELITRLLTSQLSNVFALSLFRTRWKKSAVSESPHCVHLVLAGHLVLVNRESGWKESKVSQVSSDIHTYVR